MPNLKQATLSFTSTKRTNSIQNGKITKKGRNQPVEEPLETQSDAKLGGVLEIPPDEEGTAEGDTTIPAKRTRASTKARSSRTAKQATSQPSQQPSSAEIERGHLDVEDKAGRYRKYYNEVRSKMGFIQPVHSEGQNKIHQILRFFDMSYEFGPCIGMTRLERWERAEAFGLNPPVEVRDILLTKEGTENAEYAQCVLHGEV